MKDVKTCGSMMRACMPASRAETRIEAERGSAPAAGGQSLSGGICTTDLIHVVSMGIEKMRELPRFKRWRRADDRDLRRRRAAPQRLDGPHSRKPRERCGCERV